METLNFKEVILNLMLLKRSRFYQMFDPRSVKIWNLNVYFIPIVLISAFSQCVLFLALMGFFVHGVGSFDYAHFSLFIYVFMKIYLTCFMIYKIISNSHTIWDLFPVSKFDFLKSKKTAQNVKILHEYREKTIRITNALLCFFITVTVQWAFNPFVLNSIRTIEDPNLHLENVINFPYPVETHTYNKYYVFFYISEVSLLIMAMYISLIFDGVFISIYYAIIGQYKIIAQLFQSIGSEDKTQTEYYSDFKSILLDQQLLNVKFKSFYSVLRPIVLAYSGANVGLSIVVIFLLISVCLSMKSFSIFDLIKLFCTVVLQYSHFFLYCNLLENIYSELSSINFAMYSCNWTNMDIQFKKLLLLAMRINDANQSLIRFSPKKIVNLQLFANVVTTSYNIVSVMINTLHKKK